MEYKTSDLYLAAYLRVSGISLTGTERIGSKVVFLFENPGDSLIENLKQDYFLGRARVPALSYSQSIRSMKSLIFQAA